MINQSLPCFANYYAVSNVQAPVPALEVVLAEATKPPADPPHAALVVECDAVLAGFAHVPALRDAIQQRDELQRELSALNAAKSNFREIARAGTAHKAAVDAAQHLPLFEEDYLTLADRYAALVQLATTTCEELADAEDYDAVTFLGDKLNELKALDVSALPSSDNCHAAVPSGGFGLATLTGQGTSGIAVECNALVAQFANAPRTREAMQHRDELQNTLTALRAAKSDFAAVGQAGKALKAAAAVLAQLPLSEDDYLTLADRHVALVQQVTATCSQLADVSYFDALDALAIKLEELQALDVSALPQPWANDPVQPPAPPAPASAAEEGEVEWTNDPLYVSPAPGTSHQDTVPPACTVTPVTADETTLA
jgi:hypothetical protein